MDIGTKWMVICARLCRQRLSVAILESHDVVGLQLWRVAIVCGGLLMEEGGT